VRSHDPIPALVSVISLSPEKKSYICLFHGKTGSLNGLLPPTEQQDLVQRLIHLLTDHGDQPVHDLVREAAIATGVNNVGLFLAEGETPAFNIASSVGDPLLLPTHIPTRDIPMLKKIVLWTPGNRTTPLSNLIITARTKKLSFLASFPIGSPEAMIGFLVFTDQGSIPPPELSAIGAIFAAFINLAITHHSVLEALTSSLTLAQDNLYSLSLTAEHIQEGLITISPDLIIKGMNPAAEVIFGYSSQEAYNQPVEHILIGSETLSSYLEDAQKGQDSQHKDHLRLYRRNGEDFLAHLRFLPVQKGNVLIAIVILVDDLSEKEKIRIQTEQLEQRAFLGEVTAIFAHEVRNPINNISTGLQLMARTLPVDDPNQVEITRLEQDCDRLVELMKSVLSLSKPTDYHMIALDIGQLIQRILDRRITRLQNTRIFLDLQVDPETLPVSGDPRALEQVFNNLINNALQAMGESGGNLVVKIYPVNLAPDAIEVTESPPLIEISIADTGPGIPKEIQDRIFQPFFTTRSGGTGLGLAIAKRIVTFHKGSIRLESFPGGTVFYVTLPVDLRTSQQGQRGYPRDR
jgi:PAS domain S-box-containing protein